MAKSVTISNVNFHDNFACVSDLAATSATAPLALITIIYAGFISISDSQFEHNMAKNGMISITMMRKYVNTADYNNVNIDLKNLDFSYTFSSYAAQAITISSNGNDDEANVNTNIESCSFEYGHGVTSLGAIVISGVLSDNQKATFTYTHPITQLQYQVDPPYIKLKSLTFENNYAGKSGCSGVSIEQAAVVTMTDCKFSSLTGHGNGTPINYSMWQYLRNNHLIQSDPPPSTTVKQQAAGTVSFMHILVISVTNSMFNDNDGGTSSILSAYSYYTLSVSNAIFTSNKAQGNTAIALQFGMCPQVDNTYATISSSSFSENKGEPSTTRGVVGNLQNINCNAKLSSVKSAKTQMTSLLFEENNMGIYVDSGSTLKVTGTKFIKNESSTKAVVYFSSSNNPGSTTSQLIITSCTFTGNSNSSNSADISVSSNTDDILQLQISGCSFTSSHGGLVGSIEMMNGLEFSTSEGDSFISNCQFTNVVTDWGGGAIQVAYDKGVFLISSTSIINPSTGINGAISAIDAAQEQNPQRTKAASALIYLKLESVTITGSTVALAAISITETKAELRTKSCTFSNNANVVVLNSGGYYEDTGSTFTGSGTGTARMYYKSLSKGEGWMTGTTFRSGYSQDYGGAIYLIDYGTSLTVTGGIFDSNSAVSKGGAIYIANTAIAVIQGCTFTSNKSASGSAIYQLTSRTATTTISNSSFRSNSGVGVVYILEGNISITTSTFDSNISTASPGLYALLSSITTSGCTFMNHQCSQGCFISAIAESTYIDSGSTFTNGISSLSGSVAFIQGSVASLTGSSFSANKSGSSGTLRVLNQSTLSLARVTFTNCLTTYGATSGASILHLEQSSLVITGPSYMQYFNNMGIYINVANSVSIDGLTMSYGNATAVDGGGLNCVGCSSVSIANSVFQHIESVNGGCMMLEGVLRTVYTITNSKFQDCKAIMGGAIYADSKGLTILKSNFTENTATKEPNSILYDYGRGGALYLLCADNTKCPSTINDTVFSSNTAYSNGGAICWENYEPKFSNVTYSGNGALYGNDRASFAVQIAPWKDRYSSRELSASTELSNVVSGQVGKSPLIYMALYDKYEQIVTTDNSSAATLNTNSPGTSLSGTQKTTAYYGTFVFDSYGITAEPGSKTEIYVSSEGIDTSKTALKDSVTNIQVSVRNCIMGEIYTSAKACLVCESNTYSLEVNATYCSPCPSTAVCRGGADMYPLAGYWRSKNTTDKFFTCPKGSSCLGNLNYTNSVGACATGYTGNLCNTCETSYSRTAKNTCQACPDPEVNGVRIGGLTIGVVILIVFLVRSTMSSALRPRELASVYLRILMNYLQLVMLTATFNLNWPSEVETVLSTQESAGTATAQVFSFDCYMTGVSDTNVIYQKLIMMFILPGLIVSISVLFWGFIGAKQNDFSIMRKQMVSTIIILLFLAHPNIVQAMFSMLSCTEIDPGESWLVADPSIRCWQGEHLFYTLTIAIPGVAAWCLGIPTIALLLVVTNSRELKFVAVKAKYGFLYNGYRMERYYWEFVIIYRKVLIIFISVFVSTVSVEVQALSVMLVIIVAFYLQHANQPYDVQELNDLELLSIFTSGITIYSGLYFLTNDLNNTAGMVFFALIVLSNTIFLTYWAFGISQAYMEKIAKMKPRLMSRLCRCIPSVLRVANTQIKNLDLQNFDVVDEEQQFHKASSPTRAYNTAIDTIPESEEAASQSEYWMESDFHLYVAVMKERMQTVKTESSPGTEDLTVLGLD
jgi:predicted outer membrane repeat protein